MSNYSNWLKNLKAVSKKAFEEKERNKVETETFPLWFKKNHKAFMEQIIDELKPEMEKAAKEGKSFVEFNYYKSYLWICPETLSKVFELANQQFKYLGRPQGRYDWLNIMEPYFKEYGLELKIADNPMRLLEAHWDS